MRGVYAMVLWTTIWILFCAIQDYALKIESSSYVMAYGIIAYKIADSAVKWAVGASWVTGDSNNEQRRD